MRTSKDEFRIYTHACLSTRSHDRQTALLRTPLRGLLPRLQCVPENKYKYFPTFIPNTWKLLNELEHHTENQPQQWQQDAAWNQNRDNQVNPQQFMENWQTVWHSRQQHRQQIDNGWLVCPAQTTLDGYLNHTATNEQPATHRNCRPTQQNTPWGDRDPNEQGPRSEPDETWQNREHTPLKYV
jgi:hypothetical protein